MRIDVLTIFPEMFPPVLGSSILARAAKKNLLRVRVRDLRDWSMTKHRKVDDRPYGGGPGMVMRAEPFFLAVEAITKGSRVKGEGWRESRKRGFPSPSTLHPSPYVILLSPQGQKLTQKKAEALAKKPWLVLLCGHYEGVDERVRRELADEELSIGDYVLTCGELPAMVLIDSVVRLLPGVLGDAQSAAEESFSGDLLEYPHYTRPADFRGMRVPDVLLSGDAPKVAEWRRLQSLRRTRFRRPDLMR